MTTISRDFDGVIATEWRVEGGKLVRRMVQPNEQAILDFNAEIRRNPDAIRKLEWGAPVINIPENIYWLLVKKFPDLNARHGPTRTAAWLRLLHDRDYEKLTLVDRNLARR